LRGIVKVAPSDYPLIQRTYDNLVNLKAEASHCPRRRRPSTAIGVPGPLRIGIGIGDNFGFVTQGYIDVVLIRDRPGQNLFVAMSDIRVARPNLPIIVIGPSTDDATMLNATVCGAKGHVFDGSAFGECARALRVVS
jgi:hypothetical protein